MRKTIAACLLVLACTIFSMAAQAQVKPGDVPPASLGETLDGTPINLTSMHGKVVVISFWATWCSYCMQEMPILANLQTVANERKLPLQVVSIDYKEDRQTFARITRVLRPRFPSLMLSWDRDGKIGEPYGTHDGIPVMVMLHRDGTVAHVHVGYGKDMLDDYVAEINSLLTEPVPAAAVARTP